MNAPSTPALRLGDPAPWFKAKVFGRKSIFSFDTMAGRHILLLFFRSATSREAKVALAAVAARGTLFDDDRASFFSVGSDAADGAAGRIKPSATGIRHFLDHDGAIRGAYGVDQGWLILDPGLRVIGHFAIESYTQALAAVAKLRDAAAPDQWAPVLAIPHVFEPSLCRKLIAAYEADGGRESGVMRDLGGKTAHVLDAGHKRRSDVHIEDPALCQSIRARITRRIVPSIRQAFQFEASRIKRYLVACYDAESGGHFRAHRDNTALATAYRRFAVTINLNAEDYEGGDLRFPEFGSRSYRAPTGGAIVFSCSLLHEVSPVTRGRRFAFLPFLHDEAADKIRAANEHHFAEDDAAESSIPAT